MDQNLKWNNGFNFTSQIRGHELTIDAALAVGGTNRGPTPKELLLTGIAGCSAMDSIAYLKKHKQDLLDLNIKTNAELTTTNPKHFTFVHLVYQFLGDNLNQDHVIKSIESSMTKYCGVSYMLSKTCPITYSIELNGTKIFDGIAKF